MNHLLLALVLAAAPEERALKKTVTVAAPIEKVWEAFTTCDGVKTFFAPDCKIDAKPDGPYEIYFNPYAPAGMKGADGMRVLAVQPQKLLSFTWNAPPHLPQARGQRTSVVLRFAANGKNTDVTLYHAGWGDGGEWDQAFQYFDKAWGKVLGGLQERFVKGPTDWTAWLAEMKKATDEMTKKK